MQRSKKEECFFFRFEINCEDERSNRLFLFEMFMRQCFLNPSSKKKTPDFFFFKFIFIFYLIKKGFKSINGKMQLSEHVCIYLTHAQLKA